MPILVTQVFTHILYSAKLELTIKRIVFIVSGLERFGIGTKRFCGFISNEFSD